VRQIQGLDFSAIAETGDSWFKGIRLTLPTGARFEIEIERGRSDGLCRPPSGYAVGARNRRIVAMIGDGSFQFAAQEVAQMIRRKLPVIIFLIDNHGYTIEVEILDGPYSNIRNWDYAGLIQAFNAGVSRGRQVARANARPPSPQ